MNSSVIIMNPNAMVIDPVLNCEVKYWLYKFRSNVVQFQKEGCTISEAKKKAWYIVHADSEAYHEAKTAQDKELAAQCAKDSALAHELRRQWVKAEDDADRLAKNWVEDNLCATVCAETTQDIELAAQCARDEELARRLEDEWREDEKNADKLAEKWNAEN